MQIMYIMALNLAVAAPLPDDPALKVVQKAVEANGGKDLLLAKKGCVWSGRMVMKLDEVELDCEAEEKYQIPDKTRLTLVGEVAGQKLTLVQTYNAGKLKVTVNGDKTELKDYEIAEAKQSVALQEALSLAPLLDTNRYTLKTEKDEKVGDKDATVLTVSAKDMKEVKFYFDKQSGLVLRTQTKAYDKEGKETVDEVTDYSEYKKIDGIETAMKSKTYHDGKLFATQEVKKLKYFDKLDDKDFELEERKGL